MMIGGKLAEAWHLVYRYGGAGCEPAIAELLIACDLPANDIGDHIASVMTVHCDGQLVATVGFENLGDVGLLRSLAVTPAWRQRGIAGELYRRILGRARKAGVRELFALTTTAEEFFDRRGWRRVERSQVPEVIRATREYTSLCPASATVLAHRLDEDF